MFARLSILNDCDLFPSGCVPPTAAQVFAATNNLMYLTGPPLCPLRSACKGGCTYTGGFPFTDYQQWNSNLYWRTDGAFATYAQAFHVQPNPGAGSLCAGGASSWTFYTFARWQKNAGQDAQSVVLNPGFNNPAYPADDYSLPKGSPGAGFGVRPEPGGPLESRDRSARGPGDVRHQALQSRDGFLARLVVLVGGRILVTRRGAPHFIPQFSTKLGNLKPQQPVVIVAHTPHPCASPRFPAPQWAPLRVSASSVRPAS